MTGGAESGKGCGGGRHRVEARLWLRAWRALPDAGKGFKSEVGTMTVAKVLRVAGIMLSLAALSAAFTAPAWVPLVASETSEAE